MFLHGIQFLPLVFLLVVSASAAATGETRCIEREREALLRFKQGITYDYYGCLSSWHDDNKDCCEWGSVNCSDTAPYQNYDLAGALTNISGSATAQVTYIYLYGCYLRGNISSDLLELHHLTSLDMTFNYFGGSIPKFFGSITSLEDLRLTYNNFTGTIPYQLGNLTNLCVLTLNFNSLFNKIPKSFANLTNLEVFYINVNHHLGEPLADFFGKLSCRALKSLDISLNQYTGEIPDLSACLQLETLKIHHNHLSGSLPASMGKLPKLADVDASFNSFNGAISESFFSESDNKLFFLILSYNPLTLNFSPNWIPPFQLEHIGLARCKIGPSFPNWLRTQTKILGLDISDAGIVDQVPDWFWSFSPVLENLNLSHNQISGTISNLSSNLFGIVDISSNNFSGALPLLHRNITFAHFGQNSFTGEISSICGAPRRHLAFLDLSGNQFRGPLPNCWNNTIALKVLNLNDNHFHGEITPSLGFSTSLETLSLRGNNLSGELPPDLRSCRGLKLIDIGENKLTGEIPPWLAAAFPNMSHFSFRQNRFHGGIPPEICHLNLIQMLDLSGNDVSGEIPTCFNNFTSLVERNAPITPPISYFINYMSSYFSSVLVQWKGRNLEYGRYLQLLKLIDLSSNRLTGSIPEAFSSLKGLISLNLSRNGLSGRMDPNIGQMEMLETLDLSNNHLSGEIPIGLARMHFLGVLDLSSNNLTGEIPLGTQLQGFNASAYSGNDGLCGPPLPSCRNTSVGSQGEDIKKESDSFMTLQDFYIPLIFGAIVGFWGFVGSLVLNRSWRYAYFGLIQDFADCFM